MDFHLLDDGRWFYTKSDKLVTKQNKQEKSRKRSLVNNTLDYEMTDEKVKVWKKEFTFWDTADGNCDKRDLLCLLK